MDLLNVLRNNPNFNSFKNEEIFKYIMEFLLQMPISDIKYKNEKQSELL